MLLVGHQYRQIAKPEAAAGTDSLVAGATYFHMWRIKWNQSSTAVATWLFCCAVLGDGEVIDRHTRVEHGANIGLTGRRLDWHVMCSTGHVELVRPAFQLVRPAFGKLKQLQATAALDRPSTTACFLLQTASQSVWPLKARLMVCPSAPQHSRVRLRTP